VNTGYACDHFGGFGLMLGSGTAVQYGMPAAARLKKEEHGAGIKGSHGCMIDTVMLLGSTGAMTKLKILR